MANLKYYHFKMYQKFFLNTEDLRVIADRKFEFIFNKIYCFSLLVFVLPDNWLTNYYYIIIWYKIIDKL